MKVKMIIDSTDPASVVQLGEICERVEGHGGTWTVDSIIRESKPFLEFNFVCDKIAHLVD